MNVDAFSEFSRQFEQAEHSCLPSKGNINVEGLPPIETSVKCVDVGEKVHFPGSERLLVQVAPNVDGIHDFTYLENPGYGETPAQEADKIRLIIEAALAKGYTNPLVISAVPQGRGTPAYNAPGANISAITLKDYLGDVADLTRLMVDRNLIGGNVVVDGHSLGNLAAMEATRVLLDLEEKNAYKVETVIDLMGAIGKPLSLIDPGFFLRVAGQIPNALEGAITGKGAICLPPRDYNFMMFNERSSTATPNSIANECDSARVFTGITFNTKNIGEDIFPSMVKAGVSLWVVSGEDDRLIPKSSARIWTNSAIKAGVETQTVTLNSFSHSIPYNMNSAQETEFRRLLDEALPEKR